MQSGWMRRIAAGSFRHLQRRSTIAITTDIPYIMRSRDDAFEWDAEKAADNWRDHGVTFDDAIKAFRDAFIVEWIDDREAYGEERVKSSGHLQRRHPACDLYRTRRADQDHLGQAGRKT